MTHKLWVNVDSYLYLFLATNSEVNLTVLSSSMSSISSHTARLSLIRGKAPQTQLIKELVIFYAESCRAKGHDSLIILRQSAENDLIASILSLSNVMFLSFMLTSGYKLSLQKSKRLPDGRVFRLQQSSIRVSIFSKWKERHSKHLSHSSLTALESRPEWWNGHFAQFKAGRWISCESQSKPMLPTVFSKWLPRRDFKASARGTFSTSVS